MPRQPIAMFEIKEILRLHYSAGHTQREISRATGVSQSAIQRLLGRAGQAGLGWPLAAPAPSDAELYAQLYPKAAPPRYSQPDFARVQAQLRRYKHVTLEQLWGEYREQSEPGQSYSYSQFCARYKHWRQSQAQEVVLVQDHVAGEKLFIDYAGETATVHEAGGSWEAQIFVATLGASAYSYVEASRGQDSANFLAAHVRAFRFFQGVPRMLVPDNLKAAVEHADRYEPSINRSYAELAQHYATAVVPARPRKPRDKAVVEGAVLGVERQLLTPLLRQQRRCSSLGELNEVLWAGLEAYNAKPFQKRPGSRQSVFASVEQAALGALPERDYEYAEWLHATVNIDHHVSVQQWHYSAPWQLLRQQVDVRLSAHSVELLHAGQRVALHRRSHGQGGYTTSAEHRPKGHREHLAWPPERLLEWAGKAGPQTARLVRELMASKPHASEAYRPCLGIIRLGKRYGTQRLEAAATRALAHGGSSYKCVKQILQRGLDQQPGEPPAGAAHVPVEHANIRGAEYFAAPPARGQGGGADSGEDEEPC